MTRRNRVDPWGDLHVVAARGLLTGNRGSLVDDSGTVVRHHRSSTLWITCLTEFGDHRQPLADPHRWTPIFFLDEAVALAAGHRPCASCRRADHRAYRDAIDDGPRSAVELDRRLASERLRRGRGLSRAADRPLRPAPVESLPDGTVVADEGGQPCLLTGGMLRRFTFDGWSAATPAPPVVGVLTPPTSVAALTGGYWPLLHPTAGL